MGMMSEQVDHITMLNCGFDVRFLSFLPTGPRYSGDCHGYSEFFIEFMMMMLVMMVMMEFTNIIKVMDSGPMQLAMIISAITFAQTSILNYTYFLNNVFRSILRLNHVLCLLEYPSRLIGAL